jgi:eukaryotic-like serine/threonine-protein kinase
VPEGDKARLRSIFEAALDLSEEEQLQLLDRECAGDPELRRETLLLLAADRRRIAEPTVPALELEAQRTAGQILTHCGAREFGDYRTTELVGSGGMAVVYKAVRRDDAFAKTVAIKILPLGLGTQDRVERFRRERQILAKLEHPNVARLLDGGATEDGVPFLVMEYVDGLPLDVYATERGLATAERIRLFLQVCDGVDYAHRRLIVHCDLKPSNILVTTDGVAKLLDFGIARLLDESGGNTLPMLTPQFASPEQAAGAPITVASDVYSLGVILGKLLDGESRDLGSIVAVATREEPERRYTSVDRLAADLRAYLENRPVAARRGTLGYRTGRFLRRNRVVAAVTAVAAVGIAAGFGLSWVEAHRARQRFEDARGLAHYLLNDMYDAVAELPSSMALRRGIVQEGRAYLDRLRRDAGNDPALLLDIARSYIRLGRLQGLPSGANLGDTSGAIASFERSQQILERLAARRPSDVEVQTELYGVSQQMGSLLRRSGRLEDALAALQRAVQTASELRRADPQSTTTRFQLAAATMSYASALVARGREAHSGAPLWEAVAQFDTALEILQGLRSLSAVAHYNLGVCYFHASYAHWELADLTGERGELEKALELQLKGAEVGRELLAADPTRVRYARSTADKLNDIGHTLTKLGRYADAEAAFRESLQRFEAIAAKDTNNREAQQDVANVCWWYAECLDACGRKAEARILARRAAGIFQGVVAQDAANHDAAEGLAAVTAITGRE